MSEALEAQIPEEWLRSLASALPVRGGEGQDRGARRLGQDHGGAEEAPRGAEGPPPGRQQMDRHRRHLALRRRRLQPRRRAHRPEGEPQQPRHQGVGQARVQGPRRQGRARHPQHQGGAAPPAPLRARGRARRARPRRHHQGHRAQGLSRHPHAPRAAQHRQGADVLRRRRLHGLAHQAGRGAVLGRAHRVQAPRVLLLPQLPLRVRVEGQRAPLDRAHADLGGAAQVSGRLQGDLRRRRLHEPLRDLGRRRLGGAHERGAGRAVDAARHRHLRALRMAQSGAGAALGLDALHQDPARRSWRAACTR